MTQHACPSSEHHRVDQAQTTHIAAYASADYAHSSHQTTPATHTVSPAVAQITGFIQKSAEQHHAVVGSDGRVRLEGHPTAGQAGGSGKPGCPEPRLEGHR